MYNHKTNIMLDVKSCLNDCEEMMEMAVMHLEEEFSHIRAGKATNNGTNCINKNAKCSQIIDCS